MEKIIKIMMVTLCAHLLYTNAELLIAVKGFAADQPATFDKVALGYFALTYSLVSALCVFHLHNVMPILVFAALDGFAVYLRINVNQEHFVEITALFFGIYTFCLILFSYFLAKQNRKQKNQDENQQVLAKPTANNDYFDKNEPDKHENQPVFAKKIENESVSEKNNENEIKITVKQITCRLNRMKNETEKLQVIMSQEPSLRDHLLATYGYGQATPPQPQPTLFP